MWRLLVSLVCAAASSAALGKETLMGLDQVSLVARLGLKLQEHFVRTKDDYVLSVFHVERDVGRNSINVVRRRPVLLQAGLLDSSKSLLNLEEDSLAVQLVARGFDVWLGNNRGNAWSKRSIAFDPERFWHFSWDEMALFDLPAQVDYVLEFTGQPSLSYVGHSQGTTQVFAALSLPENAALAKKLDLHVALAPVAYLGHMSSPLLQFLVHSPIPALVTAMGVRDFAPTPEELRDMFPEVCTLLPTGCADLLALGFGSTKHIAKEDYDEFVTDWPSGTSVRNIWHFIQGIKAGRFARFDHGPEGNRAAYGNTTAPDYDLSNYEKAGVPTVFVSGSHDMLADPKDVARLERVVRPFRHIKVEGYAHMDFLWARDAAQLVYPAVIELLDVHSRIGVSSEN